MPSKLKKAIGAVKDQTSIGLAKVSSNSSSNLEVAVLKATTHDEVPIDERHVEEVLQLVSSDKTHAAACARAIGKRIGRTRNWIVALKSLMLVLRIFQDGDPYFPREVLHAMKRGAKILNLSSFRDDSNSSPWDFTAFVRTFALYLDERLECFLTGKLQRRYRHEGSTPGYVRTRSRTRQVPNEAVRDMKPAMLLDKMSYWQRLLDRAIATRPTGSARNNRLVQIGLHAIVQESFELYRDISDGLTLVLDSFFHMQYQNCVVTFQTCVKAVKQYEELSAFYSLCKSMGVGRTSEYPSVQGISEELMETLQEFLKDQSCFPSSSKPANRLLLLAPPSSTVGSRSSRHDSYGGQSELSTTTDGFSERSNSEFGSSHCTSLEDLISATESWKGPSISIDLETYSNHQHEEGFRVSDTGSCRSLPVSNSMADLMSLDDWSDRDEKDANEREKFSSRADQAQREKQLNGDLKSQESKNWEAVFVETLASPVSTHTVADNNTNTFSTSQEQTQPIKGNDTNNTFYAFTEQSSPAKTNQNPSLSENTAPTGWELVLFEAVQPQRSDSFKQATTNNVDSEPNNHHYNPFLEDAFELYQQPALPEPTFQATPTFSVQNQNQSSYSGLDENDPFNAFSGAEMLGGPIDQQDLMRQQQLWLQNQNKIIAKHM